MEDKCYYCGNDSFEIKNVSMILQKENKIYKIQNVPAKVCTRCEEQYLNPKTSISINELINNKDIEHIKIEAEQLEFV